MSIDRMPDNHWDSLVTELWGFQDGEQQALGGVDEMLIARYLAGDCDEQERKDVEQAARSSPEVRECIDLARQALGSALPEPVRSNSVSITAGRLSQGSPTRFTRRFS